MIGKQIRAARLSRDLNQGELAEAIGWEREAGQVKISKAERGVHPTSIDDLIEISKALDYPLIYFIAPLSDFPDEFVETILSLPPAAIAAVSDFARALRPQA